MTCIIGIVKNGNVYIGGDSLGVSGYEGRPRSDKKVFRNGKFIMGFTSSYRMGQLLNYSFSPRRGIEENEDIMRYMVNVFVEDVRKCLKDGGYARKVSEQEEAGVFLVGFEGRLFRIDSDYQVAEHIDEFVACGCGEYYAAGCLFANRHLEPEPRIIQALEAAEHFSVGVKAPFTIITL